MYKLVITIIVLVLFAVAGIYVGTLIGANIQLHNELSQIKERPIPTITITNTPKPIIKIKNKIIYKNGYANITEDPLWNCAGNWYNAYIRLANGGPAGDTSLWSYYCPNIPEPAN